MIFIHICYLFIQFCIVYQFILFISFYMFILIIYVIHFYLIVYIIDNFIYIFIYVLLLFLHLFFISLLIFFYYPILTIALEFRVAICTGIFFYFIFFYSNSINLPDWLSQLREKPIEKTCKLSILNDSPSWMVLTHCQLTLQSVK